MAANFGSRTLARVDIGIAFDLRSDFPVGAGAPEDRLEEYDSDATVDAIARALAANGHAPRRLGGGRAFLERVLREPPAMVFNIAEGYGTRSREAHVPAVLEMLGIPCTHSDPLTCAVTLDKAVAKKLVAADGVPTPRWVVADSGDAAGRARLSFPVIAKPLAEGSSMGIRKSSRIEDPRSLREAVEGLVAAYGQPVLVEEFCPGPEITVGILGNGDGAHVIAAMEIVPRIMSRETFVYSLEVKRNYEAEVEYRVPPRQPDALVARVHEVALRAYRSLGCRDVARVDLRVGADGEPKFLEVNPLPGLNPVTGDIVILSGRAGLSYERLIGGIVDAARKRCGR